MSAEILLDCSRRRGPWQLHPTLDRPPVGRRQGGLVFFFFFFSVALLYLICEPNRSHIYTDDSSTFFSPLSHLVTFQPAEACTLLALSAVSSFSELQLVRLFGSNLIILHVHSQCIRWCDSVFFIIYLFLLARRFDLYRRAFSLF